MTLQERLETHDLRRQLIHHPFFEDIDSASDVSKGAAAVFVGQWWHPLAYFPYFLSRLISVSPQLPVQTATSSILNEELGEGNPSRAHANVFIETMASAGFTEEQITGTPPNEATRRLVEGYQRASDGFLTGLGFMYGTEVADLAMVSGIGKAVRKATGITQLAWVNIHIEQEPGHVDNASEAVGAELSNDDVTEVLRSAEEMWSLWIDFFSAIRVGDRVGADAAV